MGMATFILDEARKKAKREFKPVVPTPPSSHKPVVNNPTSQPPQTAIAREEAIPVVPEPVKVEEPKKEEPKKEEVKAEEPKKEEPKVEEKAKPESKLRVRK